MDDRFLRYLKEGNFSDFIADDDIPDNQPQVQNDPINQSQAQNDPINDPINQLSTIRINPVLDPQESAQAAQVAAQDQTQPEQPMDVQAEIQKNPEPANEKDLIKDVFQKIGWEKYIKEESIIGGQNVNGQNS